MEDEKEFEDESEIEKEESDFGLEEPEDMSGANYLEGTNFER